MGFGGVLDQSRPPAMIGRKRSGDRRACKVEAGQYVRFRDEVVEIAELRLQPLQRRQERLPPPHRLPSVEQAREELRAIAQLLRLNAQPMPRLVINVDKGAATTL